MSNPSVVVPDADDAFFFAGALVGELRLRRCAACGRLRHPPTPMCGACHSTAVDWVVAAGTGVVHAWILSRHPARPDEPARVVALVDLPEGCRVVTDLVDTDPGRVRVGMPVTVCFPALDGVVLPCFRPAEGP